ncbi:class I SAM-dependent methyltransferase [Candidatus Kaiserbacteria bacterium]|nr:class I SAM-dependent methyltransferase [Candidatus Kaiserbacteria bacterium]
MSAPSCKLCGSTRHAVIRDTLRHGIKRKVLRCIRCSFVFLEPKKKGSRDYYSGKEYRKRYGPTINKASTPREIFDMYLPFQSRIVDEFRNALKPGIKVLDVGCSAGHLLAALKGKVKERVGIELSREEAAFVRKTQGIPVYSEAIETVDIPEGPFDLVVSARVLEHVEDPLVFLKALARHVKPGGYVYLDVPNLNDALLSLFNVSGYADRYFREPHLSYFSPKTFKRFLTKAGYRGTVKTVQRYNMLNAMNWIETGKPQANFTIGNRIPTLAEDSSGHTKARRDLNALIKVTDERYKRILEKHGLGEALVFFGTVNKSSERK